MTKKNNFVIVAIFLIGVLVQLSYGQCEPIGIPLNIANAFSINGYVRFIYANPGGTGTSFVEIRNAQSCGPGVNIGGQSQSSSYFAFDNGDKMISACLLSAISNSMRIQLFPNSTFVPGSTYNTIKYVLLIEN
jgi:hypothetical protein